MEGRGESASFPCSGTTVKSALVRLPFVGVATAESPPVSPFAAMLSGEFDGEVSATTWTLEDSIPAPSEESIEFFPSMEPNPSPVPCSPEVSLKFFSSEFLTEKIVSDCVRSVAGFKSLKLTGSPSGGAGGNWVATFWEELETPGSFLSSGTTLRPPRTLSTSTPSAKGRILPMSSLEIVLSFPTFADESKEKFADKESALSIIGHRV
jgi:hypothetical protein